MSLWRCGVALIVYAVVSYWISTSVVLSISGAHEVTKEEEWEFVRRVENLAIGSGLPMPKTWVLEDSAPNAFATGRDPKYSRSEEHPSELLSLMLISYAVFSLRKKT